VKQQVQNKWTALALVLIGLIVVASIVVPVPFVKRSPGPVFDVLGDIDGSPVLQIKGTKSHPTSGRLDMTTVSEAGGSGSSLYVTTAVLGLFDPDSSVVPAEERFPDGEPSDQDREVQERVFAASQSTAVAAAADYLERPVTSQAIVFDVIPEAPADGVLKAADVIETVNGQAVDDRKQVGEIIGVLPTGSRVVFEFIREGAAQTKEVPTQQVPVDPEDPEGEQKSVVGVLIDNHYESDFEAEVALDDIGGPSAGLVFSMAMVDRLQKEDLFQGHHVAGTGTIGAKGSVGAIGGIDKKLVAAHDAGAELFLAPARNCKKVAKSTPAGLTVVPVESLDTAIQATKDWLAGRELASCEVDAVDSGKNS
jgi:PDZ domain-containing protein